MNLIKLILAFLCLNTLAFSETSTDEFRNLSSEDGLIFDKSFLNGQTSRDYSNIELKLEFQTDSPDNCGVYLRGLGRVALNGIAQTGGSWNSLRVIHIGNRQWIWLNNALITDGLKSYPYSIHDAPLPASGPICFKSHNTATQWRSISVRNIGFDESVQRLRGNEANTGYTSIFNGRDFKYWDGDSSGKTIENGILHWKSGGNLYHENEFSDFIFRFEFTLSPGANNGLAIRSHKNGEPAYHAMTELQILDNSSPNYANLDPRQYHGSAYGKTAALRGYLNPTGEWNYQEVKVQGSTLQVELNGTRILETDISQVTQYFQDKPHPGKTIKTGYLGFAGHGEHHLKFRNLSLKEID